MMKLYDISTPISQEMVVYKNKEEKKPHIQTLSSHEEGKMHETRVALDLHTGTHVDFPLHALAKGKVSHQYPIEQFMGKALVVDCTLCKEAIHYDDVAHLPIKDYDFILFKTQVSPLTSFDFEFIYLAEDAAIHLAQFPLKGVGIDALGIERNQPHHESHRQLLGSDILIYEGLALSEIKPGPYTFMGFPLAIQNVEASLVRALLMDINL